MIFNTTPQLQSLTLLCKVSCQVSSQPSAEREKHPCLWMAVCHDELSCVKLHPPISAPKKLKQRAHSQQVERDPSCPFIMHSVSQKLQVQNYTFNVNFELTTSKGKQLPMTTSLLYSLGEEESASWFWEKSKTQASHMLVEKNLKPTTLSSKICS